MTRAKADEFVSEYDDMVAEYRIVIRVQQVGAGVDAAFLRMNAVRERLIDRLCGEEATQPLAGSAP